MGAAFSPAMRTPAVPAPMPAPAVFRGGSDGAPSRVQRTGLRALPPQAAATATPAGIARGAGVIRRQAGGAVARERLRVVPIGQAPSLAGAPGTSALTVGGPGAPLQAEVRVRLESAFGADLDAVRVHEGTAAARLALGEGARAFAWGHHVVLGAGESPRDLALMAHEVAHVLQQRGAPAVQRCAGGTCGGGGGMGGAAHEAEAARAAAAVVGGGSYAVTGRAASGEAQHAGEDEGLLGYVVWPILDRVAPSLVPIIRRGAEGVADWVKGKVSDAVGAFVDSVMAPVRSVAATGKWLHAHFGPLLASIQDAAAKIAQNDCKPITDAAKKIEDFAAELITPVVEKLQFVANKVGDFLNGVWEKFGSPVWDFIKKYAGAQWDALQQLGSWIWDKTATVREYGAAAWRWLKNKIGIGDGPEGQNGILQWIQGKARTAWDWVQAKIEPYKKQLKTVATVVGAIVVMLSPAGPLILAGTAIYGIVQGVKWIRANLGGGDAIVRARVHAQTVLIPQLIATIGKATGAVTKMAGAVSGKLGEFSAGLGVLVGKAASTALQFLIDAAQWIAVKAQELADWAADKLNGAAAWLQTALTRLLAFLQPVLDFLGKVGRLIVDIYSLPLLLAGALWKKIPACIRDPFVDWIIPLILRQIDIFKELVKDDEAWAKTKADVMNIVRLVFVNKDLKGAIKATFHLILRVFNVPYDLLVQVVAKAQAAWETVTAAPIKFLKNIVRTLGRGLKLYWGKLKDNLLFGLEGWLFGAIADKGIAKPKSWTDPWDLMQFGLDVMGLSMSHIFELMEKRFEKSTVDRLRVWYARLGRAWDWIMDMKGKKPGEVTAEIIGAAKEMGKTMLEGIVIWIIEAVGTELATMATAAAASAGLSEVLDAVRRIYRAIKTAVRWARSIVDMVNRTLDAVADIAAGSLDGPAEILHGAMKKATPAVIGFLGDQVGLGDVVTEIRSLIDKLRKKVDDAILAIIDKLRAFFGAIAQGAKDVAGAILGWLGRHIPFTTPDGESHSLHLEQRGGTIVLLRSSGLAQEIMAYLDSLNFDAGDPKAKELQQAKTLAPQILLLTRNQAQGQTATTPSQEALVLQKVTELSKLMMRLVQVTTAQLPAAADWSKRAKTGNTQYSHVYLLSSRTATGGSGASGTTPEIEYVASARWVRAHLIPSSIGGRGEPSNWVPVPINVNSSGAALSFEKAAETAVRSAAIPAGAGVRPQPSRPVQPNVIWMENEVTAYHAPVIDKRSRTLNFPRTISRKFGLYRPEATTWVKLNASLSEQILTVPPLPDNKIRLSSSSGTAMLASGIPHLSDPEYGPRLVTLIKEIRGAGLGSYDTLESRLLAATLNSKLLPPARVAVIVADFRSNPDVVL